MGWANLYIVKDRMAVMDFSDYFLVEPACILMKKPNPYHGIYSLVLPLSKETWAGFGIALLALAAFYLLHSRLLPLPPLATLVLHGTALTLARSDDRSHRLYTHGLR